MKHDISFLPEHKQAELRRIVELARKHDHPEMIILFGSYARDAWVEDKYDETHFYYQSDFDIFVVVETDSEYAQAKIERKLRAAVDETPDIKTPVSFIIHDI